MGVQARYGGVWQSISSCNVFVGGSWRTIQKALVYQGGSWKTVANFVPPFTSVTISPSPFFRGSHSSSTITSGLVTATPTGGSAPYTYAWSVLSSSPTTVTIDNPSSASTTVTADASSGEVNCSLRCTVTDASGSTISADVSGSFAYTPDTGGGGGILP